MTIRSILNDEELHQLRLAQLAGVFSKADSALAGKRVTVGLNAIPEGITPAAPAWTESGRKVTINEYHDQNMTSTRGLIVANGLNYHELCHVMYTPGENHRVSQYARQKGLHHAYNVLEDQRIESILVNKYPSTKPYLVATVAEYFVTKATDEAKKQAWPIVYGRTYLPSNIRKALRAVFDTGCLEPTSKNMTSTARLEQIIDEYKTIRYGRMTALPVIHQAQDLIAEYAELTATVQHTQPNPFDHGGNQVISGDPMPGAGDEADGRAAGGQKDAGDADEDGEDGNGKGKGDKDADKDGSTSGGIGSGNSDGTLDIDAACQEAIAQAAGDSDVIEQVQKQRRSALSNGDSYNGQLDSLQFTTKAVNADSAMGVKAFKKQLSQMVADVDPGFDRHKDNGKLNIMRAIRGDDLDTVFDQWNEGNSNAESIELVVLLDASQSMYSIMGAACEAAWVLKASVDALGGGGKARASVITFSDQAYYLYRPNDRAHRTQARRVSDQGGTRAAGALAEARNIFALSSRAHKILITVSDGGWFDEQIANPMIRDLNKAGVATASLFLMDEHMRDHLEKNMTAEERADFITNFRHNAQVFVMGTEVRAISDLGKKLVKQAVRS